MSRLVAGSILLLLSAVGCASAGTSSAYPGGAPYPAPSLGASGGAYPVPGSVPTVEPLPTSVAQADFDAALQAYKDGNRDTAVADYTKAIQQAPSFFEAYYNRGIVYEDLGDSSSAIADYTKAIEINPKYTRAWYNRGILYYKQGELDKAIDDFTQAIQIEPTTFPEAYNNRGIAYDDKGDVDHAIADYGKAIQVDSSFADAYRNRGLAYREKGMAAQAVTDLNQYLQLKPDAPDRAQVEQWLTQLKGP